MTGLNPLANMVKRIEELERRIRRMQYFGLVTDVDPKKGLVRVDDGSGTEDQPHKTDWLPWQEYTTGTKDQKGLKTRTMPVKGQQVMVLSPSGDPTLGMVIPANYLRKNEDNTPTEDFPEDSDKDGKTLFKQGKGSIEIAGDKMIFTFDDTVLTLESGKFTFKAKTIQADPGDVFKLEDQADTPLELSDGGGKDFTATKVKAKKKDPTI